jgi:hypothetical protein
MRELACGDARAKRRLRIEIAGRHDPGEEARPARRRPATAACATGHLDVEGQHDLAERIDGSTGRFEGQDAVCRCTQALHGHCLGF